MRKILFILLCLVAVQAHAQVPGDNAITPEKKEDTAAASGDPGIFIFGVQNSAYATLSADGDYTAFAVGRAGNNFSTMVFDDLLPLSRQVSKIEDTGHTTGDAGASVFGVYQTTLAASAADADYGNLKLNTLGALYSAPIPSASADGSNTQTAYGSSYISTVSTNSTLASGNVLHWVVACNTTAANKYVKFYNSGAPTCGSGTPVLRIVAPPNNCANVNLSVYGVRMASGIGFCITGGATDADTTNTAAADVYLTIGTR